MRTALLTLLLLTTPLLAQSRNDLVIPRAAAPRIFIPVAGNAQGANGTYFRSDTTIVNLRAAAQLVDLYWLPLGAAGQSTPRRTLTISAQSGLVAEDFVGEILGATGLGGIEVVGVTSTGAFDPDAQLQVASRVWTPRPDGGAGTMSQTLPSIVAGASVQTTLKAIFGMRRSSQYRLNAGVMNPSSTTQRFRITATISGPTSVATEVLLLDVPARSIRQELIPGTGSGIVQVLIENLDGGAGDWQGWASSVDNQSGDAWSQIAVGG